MKPCKFWSLFLILTTAALSRSIVRGDELPNWGTPWKLHVIDGSSKGADGVRIADVNGDGLIDLTTGWEEGGVVRVYLNPGPHKAKQTWPAVTVGKVRSAEDAVFVDLDHDGAVDVVSCCEGKVQSMYVHWAPKDKNRYLDSSAWKTEPIPISVNARMWMYCLPMQVDGKHGIDLVAGSKGGNAEIGWFESPKNPRDLAAWRWHRIYKAGWIMSLFSQDMDGDGDADILTTDRKGKNRGCWWLENPGSIADQKQTWKAHLIGGQNQEMMFMVPADLDQDGLLDVLSAVKGTDILFMRRIRNNPPKWKSFSIRLPADIGGGKGVHVVDLDLDGRLDLVFTCESANDKSGVVWLSQAPSKPLINPDWTAHEISGTEKGIKFDLIQLLDLDADGDLDVITCEERDNLGVIWYENPTK
jgi:hypothetical protein